MKKLNVHLCVKKLLPKILFLLFVLVSTSLFSQTRGVLVVTGRMVESSSPVSNGIINVFNEEEEQIDTISTNILGRFEFYLPYNNEYLVEFTAPGLITKKLKYNTTLPKHFSRLNFHDFHQVIELFSDANNVDLSFFKQPLATIKFDNEKKDGFHVPEGEYGDNLKKAVSLQEVVESTTNP